MATEVQEAEIILNAPDAVPPVAPEKASGLVPIKDEQRSQLDTKADEFVAELALLDPNSPEFGKKVDQLTTMGRKEIAEAAGQSNRFLDRPVRAMNQETGVGADLAELRRTIEDLDPGKKGDLFTPKKLFGIIPYGNKMRNYFDGYKSSQGHIASILSHLASGKDELLKDNAAIDVERQNLWAAMGRLEQMIHVAKALDAKLEDKANDVESPTLRKPKPSVRRRYFIFASAHRIC